MFSHLISWGRSFTWTQNSLIHLGKAAILLLRSPISASWALLVPPTPIWPVSRYRLEIQPNLWSLSLQQAYYKLSLISSSTWLLLLFPQPPEEYASHLPAVTLEPAPLGPHSAPVKVRISQMLRGKGTVFVTGEIPCDSKHSIVDRCTH